MDYFWSCLGAGQSSTVLLPMDSLWFICVDNSNTHWFAPGCDYCIERPLNLQETEKVVNAVIARFIYPKQGAPADARTSCH